MRTHQIMTRKVITVGAASPIVDAANIMLEKHVSGLPVVDEAGKLVGIVSQGDFIRRAEIGTQRKRGRWLKFLLGPGKVASDFVHERGRKAGEIMTLNPWTVTEDTTLEDVVQLMEHNNVKRLPVMRGDQLVGIVTRSNLLRLSRNSRATSRIRRPTTITFATISPEPSRRRTGRHSVSASLCVTVMYISAV